jgi:hypothetical protein
MDDYHYFSFSNLNNVKIGAEIKIDEYVPNIMPKNTSTLKLLIASPPNIIRDALVRRIVRTVSVVLDNVSFILVFIMLHIGLETYLRRFSLIRS